MLLRILLWTVLFFFLARFVWKILSRVLRTFDEAKVQKPDEESPSSKDQYKDVHEAKYTDLPESREDTSSDRKAS